VGRAQTPARAPLPRTSADGSGYDEWGMALIGQIKMQAPTKPAIK
jgi:hypothetical protein